MEYNLVLKIGGSIFDYAPILDDFIHSFIANLNLGWKYIVLVGGGIKCNQLRERYESTHPSKRDESEYHWKAIRIMEDNARDLATKLNERNSKFPVHLINDIATNNFEKSGIYILQPFEDLFKNDPLEHSWQVTSDSIALYYANRFHSPICILIKQKPYYIKDKTPLYTITSSKLLEINEKTTKDRLLGKGFVDPVCPHLCKEYEIPLLIMDGTDMQKVSEFFSSYPNNEKITTLSSFGIEISPK